MNGLKESGDYEVFEPSISSADDKPVMSDRLITELKDCELPGRDESDVIAIVAPVLSSLLVAKDLNPRITPFLCEKYRSVLSASNRSKHDGKPDMIFADPAFFCTRVSYKGAVDLSLQYGHLTHWGVRSSMIVVVEAKVKIDPSAVGELCTYMSRIFHNCHDHDMFPLVIRGLLFDIKGFHLLKFVSGECAHYIESAWTTPGSEHLLKTFLSVKDPWSVALHLLCDTLQVNVQSYTTQELANPLNQRATRVKRQIAKGAPCLGSGRYGRAILVAKASDGTSAVLKLVIGRGVDKLPDEFNMICQAFQLCPDHVAQPLEPPGCVMGTFMHTRELNVNTSEQVEVSYGGYLLADVGSPVDTSITGIGAALRSLLKLHLAKLVHGDARIQNCIVTDPLFSTFKWIDFRDATYSTADFSSGVAHDIGTFFGSFAKPSDEFSSEQVNAVNAYSTVITAEAITEVLEAFTDDVKGSNVFRKGL